MATQSSIKVGLIQIAIEPGNVSGNLDRALAEMALCAQEGADLIVLPELFNTGYFLTDSLRAAAQAGFNETMERLTQFCRDRAVALIGGVAEPAEDNQLYNSAIVAEADGSHVFYRKSHLHGREINRFRPGERLGLFQLRGITIGVLSCYEADLPEVARALVLQGAQVLLVTYALLKARGYVFEMFTRARAFENCAFLIASSQIGVQDEFEFYGHSRVVDPNGDVLVDMDQATGHLVFPIDMEELVAYRRGCRPNAHLYFQHRRPELYGRLSESITLQELGELGLCP